MFSLFTPTGYGDPDGLQQARCGYCGEPLGGFTVHKDGCLNAIWAMQQARAMTFEEMSALHDPWLANARQLFPEPEVVRYRGSRYASR